MLRDGDVVTASDATGVTTAYSNCGGPASPPDGVSSENTDVGSFAGISGIVDRERQQMLIGVFVGVAEPTDPAPALILDFTNNHDFVDLEPALHQSFFIGDGLTGGGTPQRFHAPAGATRLFLGLADSYGFHGMPGYYGDNCYGYQLKLHSEGAPAPLTYRWQLAAAQGPPVQLSSTTDAKPSFTAFDDGVYTFRLTVSDGINSATDDVTVVVRNVAPIVAKVGADPTATDGLAQVTVSFNDRGPFDTHTVDVDWGDGSPVESVPAAVDGSGWGTGFAGHVYSSTGLRTIRVTVTDKDGGVSAAATGTVDVGGAGQGEPVPGAALWATSTTEAGAIRVRADRVTR